MSLLLSVLDHAKQAVTSPFESKPQAQAQASGVNALAASDPTSGSGTQDPSSEATITANDFLTLLVTEIQNQDPTTQTDPMEYITQLVGVNSLEQLVQINQTLSGATGTSTPAASAASSPAAAAQSNASSSNAVKPANTSSAAAVLGSSAASSAAAHLLPLGSNSQTPASAETAVAHAFTHASALPAQGLPPTQVPLSPEVMRALQRSIPGATFSGKSPLPAATAAGTGSAVR
ncbi:MAG: flagellar hook capping FlgD N-terminal domain-containing protein [Acidobacteriaceae bacterium]